jgi:hypothetical protein
MKRIAAALGALLATVVVAGCGSGHATPSLSKDSADTLLKKARAAVTAEKYVRVSGKIQDSGKSTSIDLRYVGTDSVGTIELAGASMQIEAVGATTYFKPSDAFWQQQLAANEATLVTKLIGGRWIIADPSNTNFSQLIEVAKRTFLTKEVLTPSSKVTKGKVTTINGTKAIPLKVDTGTLYLADSDARPLEVKGSGSGGSGTATFSYTAQTAPTAPSTKDQVDLSKLMAGK